MNQKGPANKFSQLRQRAGQAAVEYVLIITLIVLGLIVIISVTGPAVGNVFSNTVANLLNLTTTPEDPMSEAEFWDLVTAVASYTPDTIALITNTPAPAGDSDGDGISNEDDNCPNHWNPTQADEDGDGIGDVCDPDSTGYNVDDDNDGVLDNVDNCVGTYNPDQTDTDGDGIGDPCEPPPPPDTNTPGPSPTPGDKNFPYPYSDTDDETDWETDFNSILKGPWNAEYWSRGNPGCVVDTFALDQPAPLETEESEIQFPRASHPTWNNLGGYPADGIIADFCARYTQTFRLEAGSYTWKILVDPLYADNSPPQGDRVRVTVGSTVVYEDWDGITYDVDANLNTAEYIEVPWSVGSTAEYDVKIEYADRRSRARLEVYLLDNGLEDLGECNWTLKDTDYAGGGTININSSTAGGEFWSDSPTTTYDANGFYQRGSYCILRLRGSINLALAQFPFVEWKDQHSINNPPDTFWFAVREAGQANWVRREIHSTKTENYTWATQELSLSTFTGLDDSDNPVTVNFVGKRIEVAFIVEDWNDSLERYGWFIDNFRVYEKSFKQYAFPFTDDVEGQVQWEPEDGWGIASPPNTHSGSKAWANNPGGNYSNNMNSSLTLDGLADLTNLATVQEPELAFWHFWDVENNDKLYVEISSDLGVTWQALRSGPDDTTDYLINGSSENFAYKLERIPLNDPSINQDFRGKKVIIRFRIETNCCGNGAGWYIDDIQLRNSPTPPLVFPTWCDNLNNNNSLTNWLAEGTWGLEAATPGKGADSLPLAFSDSPVTAANPSGVYANDTNATLYLDKIIDASVTPVPILEFWHRWELGSNDWLIVELSNDDGITWTTIWDFYYNDTPDMYDPSVDQGDTWREQISWKREVVFLNDWIASNPTRRFKLRFRLDALNGSGIDDGWYLDNVCIKNYNEPFITIPWSDGFEVGNTNWYRGGEWEIAATTPGAESRTGTYMIVDSMAGNGYPRSGNSLDGQYQEDSDSVLELKPIVDLTGVSAANNKPTLYFWERIATHNSDRMYVEIQEVTLEGVPVGNWIPVERVDSNLRNDAYNRRQVDLTPYAGKYIRIRFRVQALNTDGEADGWYVDNVSLVDRNQVEAVYPLPFNQGTADFGGDAWVREGDWSILTDSRPLGSGSVLGPGQWQVDYYEKANSPATPTGFPSGSPGYEFIGTESVPEIDYNWGSSAPAIILNAHNNWAEMWMSSYKRTVTFAEETVFSIFIYSDDGHRLLIDGGNAAEDWRTCGSCQTGENPSNGNGTPFLYTFAPGSHFIEIQHFEHTGGARLEVNFTLVSGSGAGGAGEDPFPASGAWRTTYYKYCDGAVQEPAWNEANPEFVNTIDFDWGTNSAPGVVTANNIDPGGGTTPGTPGGGASYDCSNTDDFEDASLAAAWSSTNIGDASSGDVTESGGWLDVTGRGSGYWASDNIRFAYQNISGDVRVELDIIDFPLNNGGSNRKGGLTIREGTAVRDKRVMVNYLPAQGILQFAYRSSSGSTTSTRLADDTAVSLPVRVAIERVGNTYTAYYSTDDGATWIQPTGQAGGSTTFTMNTNLVAGVGISSYNTGTSFTGRFDNFSICTKVSSLPPYEADGSGNVSIPAEYPHDVIPGAGHSWQAVSIADNFNGFGMQSLPDSGTNSGDSTSGPQMTYQVNFPASLSYPRSYYFFARALANNGSGSSDSFHVGINGGTPVTYGGTGLTGFGGSWTWVNQFGGSPVTLTVPSAGVHTINIYMREDGAAVDHFYLSPISNPTLPVLTTAASCYTTTNEFWVARYDRTITTPDPLTVTFVISSNDGHRVYTRPAGGGTWTQVGGNWALGDTDTSTTLTFQPGSTEVRIEYSAQSAADGNRIRLEYVLEGPVFHSDSAKNTNYPVYYGASLILESEVDLPLGSNATLTWWDRYAIGSSDSVIVEVNILGGADALPGNPSNWTRVYEQGPGTNNNWRKRIVDLTPFAGNRIVVRFRFEGLNGSGVLDGWYVDDITIVD